MQPRIVRLSIALLGIVAVAACGTPETSRARQDFSLTPRVARSAGKCTIPIFVPREINLTSVSRYQVLSGPFTVASNEQLIHLIRPSGPLFGVRVLVDRPGDITGDVTVEDDATKAQAIFRVSHIPSAQSRQPHAAETCPREPAVIPELIASTALRFRLEGGPYTATTGVPTLDVREHPDRLDIRCAPGLTSCGGSVTVTNSATYAKLTFAVYNLR
jgi:hypothetical protein